MGREYLRYDLLVQLLCISDECGDLWTFGLMEQVNRGTAEHSLAGTRHTHERRVN